MSVTCQKEFSITIAGGLPEPLAYYKLDSQVGLVVPDSVGSRVLTLNNPPNIIVGKIGNAFENGSWQAQRSNADMSMLGVDFTFRVWFRAVTGGLSLIEVVGTASPSFNFFEIELVVAGATMSARSRIRNQAAGGVVNAVSQTIPYESVTWHHIIGWHRNGVEIGVRLDNGTAVTTPFTSGMNPASPPQELNLTSEDDKDELSIWRGQVLTTAEQDADWNGGAGLTYPFP